MEGTTPLPSVSTEPPPTAAPPPLSEPSTQPQAEIPPPSSSACTSSNPIQNPPTPLQPPIPQLNQPQQRPPLAGNRPQSPSLSSPSPSMTQKGGSAIGLPFYHFGPSRPFSQPFTPMPISNTQKIHGHGSSRAPPMASPSSPITVQQSPQPLQQPPISAQGKQMASSLPSSSYRPQVKPPAMQQRSHLLQHHQHSLPTTSHQQQISYPQQHQQQQQQQQQQQKHQRLQLQQRLQQQQQFQPQASSLHQSQERHSLQYLPHRNQQSVPQQPAARALESTAQKSNVPALVQSGFIQSGAVSPILTTDAAEYGNNIISKRSIHELFTQIDPSEKLEPEVEDALVEVADDFIESITMFACSLAKHRKSSMLESKDILLHVERNWNITLPGFGGDEIKCYKKQLTNDTHKERLAVIKKSMIGANEVGHAKNPPAGQAAANPKAHVVKVPATGFSIDQ